MCIVWNSIFILTFHTSSVEFSLNVNGRVCIFPHRSNYEIFGEIFDAVEQFAKKKKKKKG